MSGILLAVMPCRGRKETTIDCVQRLIRSASPEKYPWKLITVSGQDDKEIVKATEKYGATPLIAEKNRLTYWEALQEATNKFSEFPIIANLSNDILPAGNWLVHGLRAYDKIIGRDKFGLVGFNGDGHDEVHSCHFMIHRNLLKKYGGWPVWYDHGYGDMELCHRAREDKVYYKEPWAVLFHDHPFWFGQERDDKVYQEGRRRNKEDEDLFNARKKQGWPSVKKSLNSESISINIPPCPTFTLYGQN